MTIFRSLRTVGVSRVCFLVVPVLAVVAALAFTASSALASPLEAPEVRVEEVASSTATFFGTLSPASPGEAGASYGFVYRLGSACKGAGEIRDD